MRLYLKIAVLFIFCNFVQELWAALQHRFGIAENLIRIERYDKIAKFESNREFIENIFANPEVKDRKIVAFTIIGAYRQGKSFFLDYCLRYLYATYGSINSGKNKTAQSDWIGGPNEPLLGFSWTHGVRADTRGFLMWSDVFLYDSSNGEKIAIIVIDTQGLYEIGSNEEENGKIFSFSTLVSSIQVINIKNRLEEDQIARLETAIELTELIATEGENRNNKVFQKLIFLLRDFEDDDYVYGFEGGQRYLDYFLEAFDEQDETETKARVNRFNIRKTFDTILCFLLSHPGSIIRKKNFNGEWGKLDSNFVEYLQILIEELLAPSKIVKKTFFGKEITGEEFKHYLLDLSASYSEYRVPLTQNVFQIAIDNQMTQIVKELIINYKEEFANKTINYERHNFVQWLQREHQNDKKQAVVNFLSAKKIKDTPSEKKYKKYLEDEIDAAFSYIRRPIMEAYWLSVEKQLSLLVKKQLQTYKNLTLVQGIEYDRDDYFSWLNEKHKEIKGNVLRGFLSAEIVDDESLEEKYQKNLEDEIEDSYVFIKQSKAETFKGHQSLVLQKRLNVQQEIEKISCEEFIDFENKIKNIKFTDDELAREGFMVQMEKRLTALKAKSILDFSAKATKYTDRNINDFKNQTIKKLGAELNALTSEYLDKHHESFNAYLAKISQILNLVIDNATDVYKNEMQEVDFEALDFTNELERAHRNAKNQAFNYFDNYVQSQVLRPPMIDKCRKDLEPKLQASYNVIKVEKNKVYKELRDQGIWVPWNGSKKYLPRYAVSSQVSNSPKDCAVARFNGIVGEYCIYKSVAIANLDDREEISCNFEILTHKLWFSS